MTVATSVASPVSTLQASTPPDGLPAYRLLTGPDDASFLAVYRRNGFREVSDRPGALEIDGLVVMQRPLTPARRCA